MRYRNAFITGASSGIGEGLAVALAKQGIKVHLAARRVQELERVAKSIAIDGGKAEIYALDVTETQKLKDIITQIQAGEDGLDLVIANAGVAVNKPASKKSLDDILWVLNVNALGSVATLASALPDMVQRNRGHLVGIASLAAIRGLPLSAEYSAGKAALSIYLEGLRCEYFNSGIGFTTVYPGFVDTEMIAKNRFYMPQVWSVEKAVYFILKRLPDKPRTIYFPRLLATATRLSRLIPMPVFEFMASRSMKRLVGQEK